MIINKRICGELVSQGHSGGEIVDREAPVEDRGLPGHGMTDGKAGQATVHLGLLLLGGRATDDEPADQGEPDPA
jgi:hypothetical protein